MSIEHISANIGEWSEFYTLIKLINDAEIDVIDSQTDIEGPETKRLHSIQKDGTSYKLLDDDNFEISLNGQKINRSKSDLQLTQYVEQIFNCIKIKSKNETCNESTIVTRKGAFNLPMAERLSDKLLVSAKKQNSLSKGDIILKFSSTDTGSVSIEHDASIKSWLGAYPTLFNASKNSTRLIFSVETDLPLSELHKISGPTPGARSPRAAVSLSKVSEAPYTLKFHSYSSDILKDNLSMYDLQEIVPQIVIEHFSKNAGDLTNTSTLKKLLEQNFPSFSHKWKTLLEICTLGMTAGSKYIPATNISDNLIVINNHGELCCFIGRNRLQETLSEIAYIDTPSTNVKKHDYGYFYEKDGKYYLDLNFQIRLKPMTNRRK
jgi:hypothetical protein